MPDRAARTDWLWSAIGWFIGESLSFVLWVLTTVAGRLEGVAGGLSVLYGLLVFGVLSWCSWGLASQRRLFRGGEDVAAFAPSRGVSAWVGRPAGLARLQVQVRAQVAGAGIVAGMVGVPLSVVLIVCAPLLPALVLGWVAVRVRRARRVRWW